MSQLDQNQISGLADTFATKVDKVEGKALSTRDFTAEKDQKLTDLPAIKSIGVNLHLDPETGELIGTGGGGSGVNLYDRLGQNVDGAINQQVVTNELYAREPVVTAGESTEYYRGDKTWATLDKAAVGLANVDNTSDAEKKTAFTGAVEAENSGFVTGDAVNTALATKASAADMTKAQDDINSALLGVQTINANYIKLVASTTDIGEGQTLAANTLYAVYS